MRGPIPDRFENAADLVNSSSDAFNKLIADSTSNTVDLPSAYPFSSERYRFDVNGTRFRDISDDSRVQREEGSFLLQPNAGDVIKFFSAERPRYVVGYDGNATLSTKLNTTLDTDDRYRIGLSDFQSPENAAFIELNGGTANDRAVLLNQGTEVASQDIQLPGNLDRTDPLRWEVRFNWYGVGRFLFTVNYTDDTNPPGEKQVEKTLAELVVDQDYSTSDPNKHIFVEADIANSDKEVEVGSMGYNVFGDIIPTSRVKSTRLTGLQYDGTNNNFEAVAAARIDPDFGNVLCQVQNVNVIPDSTEGELLAIAVAPEDTDATGFDTPIQHSLNNSIWRQTTNVSTFPNEAGSVVSTADNPNGRQIGFSSSDVSGQGQGSVRAQNVQTDKRPVFEDDRVIFLYKSDSGSSDTINIQYQVQQLW